MTGCIVSAIPVLADATAGAGTDACVCSDGTPAGVSGATLQTCCAACAARSPAAASGVMFGGTSQSCPSATAPAPSGTSTTPSTGGAIQLSNPLGTTSIHVIIGRIIRGVTGIVGSIALFMFVWGGIRWIAAGGSEENVKAAQTRIKNATIGLLLIFFAYSIISAFLSLF